MKLSKFILAIFGAVVTISALSLAQLPNAEADRKLAIKVINRIKINEQRMLVLKGEVLPSTIDPLIEKLNDLDSISNEDIFLIINSPGGSVSDGMNLIRAMKSARSKIVCAIDTKAYSMAAIIATYCSKTYIHKYAAMMFHRATYVIQGHPEEVTSRVKFVNRYFDLLHAEIATNLHISKEEYNLRITNEWWLTAIDAAEFGIASAILNELKYTYIAPPPNPLQILFGEKQKTPNYIEMVN